MFQLISILYPHPQMTRCFSWSTSCIPIICDWYDIIYDWYGIITCSEAPVLTLFVLASNHFGHFSRSLKNALLWPAHLTWFHLYLFKEKNSMFSPSTFLTWVLFLQWSCDSNGLEIRWLLVLLSASLVSCFGWKCLPYVWMLIRAKCYSQQCVWVWVSV